MTPDLCAYIAVSYGYIFFGVEDGQCKFIGWAAEGQTLSRSISREYVGLINIFSLTYSTSFVAFRLLCWLGRGIGGESGPVIRRGMLNLVPGRQQRRPDMR